MTPGARGCRGGSRRGWTERAGLALLVLHGVTAAGCNERDEPPRDADAAEFWVSPDPTTVIGDGDERYEFYRVAGIAVLADGDIVVADGSTQELRVFSASGRFLSRLSRAGDGPGELRSIGGIGADRDTIVVFEVLLGPSQRHLFHPVRGFLERTRLGTADASGGVAPVEVVSAHSLLVRRGPGFWVVTPPPEGVLQRDSIELGLWRADSLQSVRWLGQFPNITWFSYELPHGRRLMSRYLLGPSLVLGASGGRVWIGDTESGVIQVLDSSATAVARFDFPLPARAFDEAGLERARRAALARVSDPDVAGQRAWADGLYDPGYRPQTAPRFVRFIPGPAGEMWVESYSEVAADPHLMVVFDSAGRHIGNGTLPAGTVPHVVTEERLIGVQVDSLGVERIVMHEVRR